ncbi:MAG: Nif3-like dinuclear metal center hexameric protein [Eggerthellaceae bacterium]|nr:Nif3-like dinuclear metal center hexameric protein [Eggerthellaceae bacterium]
MKSKELKIVKKEFLLSRKKSYTVGQIERFLLQSFPTEDACDWDSTGLCVGDRDAKVQKIVVALDPTTFALEEAIELGANLVVTHHPLIFNNCSETFTPEVDFSTIRSSVIYKAIQNNVAIMNFHTALDVAVEARETLPKLLKFKFEEVVIPLESDPEKGIGHLCSLTSKDKGMDVGQLAARCTSVFGRKPKVYGNMNTKIEKVATYTGATHGCIGPGIAKGANCLVAGEFRYNDALDAMQADVPVIELGHDLSEIPLTVILAKTLEEAGFYSKNLVILNQSHNWDYPSATRI